MKRFYLLGFLLLMGFDTLAQISFKYAGSQALPVQANLAWLLRVFGQPWVYGAVIGYIGAFFTWMALLKRAPIGPAFAASHLEVVSVMLLSIWLFDEQLTLARALGALAIIAGIVCLGLAESREHPAEADAEPARG
ncbi:DMT family transporter [Rhodanobacter denitrificans]|uniref:Cation/cationic drug transporter n=1 Tax=Rhodanobacter denitrificans TaxID=666685 RepID=M4NC90_9GAMM|nr:EamA family transporter [Rhodanobacter denitrificans]AGG88249.1 cation/cationic drug transporter [Rhodanobacter denitrificans]UJM87395.1 DMT family transporter [Rhodanobacter denitrificans]